MRNVTIKIDEDVARWARVHAAKNDTSISKMVETLLRRRMEAEVDRPRQTLRGLPLEVADDFDEPMTELWDALDR